MWFFLSSLRCFSKCLNSFLEVRGDFLGGNFFETFLSRPSSPYLSPIGGSRRRWRRWRMWMRWMRDPWQGASRKAMGPRRPGRKPWYCQLPLRSLLSPPLYRWHRTTLWGLLHHHHHHHHLWAALGLSRHQLHPSWHQGCKTCKWYLICVIFFYEISSIMKNVIFLRRE